MKILVLNCGSSSLKYQVIDMDGEKVLAKGLVERIGMDGSKVKHTKIGLDAVTQEVPFSNHTEAIRHVLNMLIDKEYGVLASFDELAGAGHRIVHGGEKFTKSVLVTDEVIKGIEEVSSLAPLHNPANLQGVKAVMDVLPGKPNVAVFDTSFHQTMPPASYLYAIPYEYYEKNAVRRYGFHGTSHRYVSARAAELLGKKPEDLKIVTCHLGNGSSVAAVKGGKCLDTSMGLSTAEGLVMGTRCGNIDPSVMVFLMEELGSAEAVSNMVQKKSGLLGLTGISSDMRDIEEAAEKGDEKSKVALQILTNGVKKYIAAYAAEMGGLDVVVFTAGIGENGIDFRKDVCADMEFLGIKFDAEANKVRGKEKIISAPDSKVTVMLIPTNEELVIARDTVDCINTK